MTLKPAYSIQIMLRINPSQRLILKYLWVFLIILTTHEMAFAQSESDPLLRSVPPIRISTGALFQNANLGNQSVHELSFPIDVQLQVLPSLGARMGVSQATAGGDNLENVSGTTDVLLALDYLVHLNDGRLVLNLGVNIPTGKSHLSDSAYETASLLALSQYNFQVPHFGQGASAAPGIAYVKKITKSFVVSLGATFRIRDTFEPIEGLSDRYNWGNEFILTLGGEGQYGKFLLLSADLSYAFFGNDMIGDAVVYEAGGRLMAQLQLNTVLGSNHVGVHARYRQIGTNRTFSSGTLLPESIRSFPGLFDLSLHYRIQPGPRLRTTLLLQSTWYQEDLTFEQLNVLGIGVAPEFTLSPSLRIPIHAKYILGDLEGIDVGIGIIAIL